MNTTELSTTKTFPFFDIRNVHLTGLYRVRPLEALYAGVRLAINPNDTGRFGSVISGFTGASFKRYVDYAMTTPEGQNLYAKQPDILGALRDRDRLKALPSNTLGYAYAKFAEEEDLSGDVLADILWEYIPEKFQSHHWSPQEQFFSDWGRDIHDLFHLVLGYHTDILGEVGVLTFAGVQNGSQGVLTAMAGTQLYTIRHPDGRRLAIDAISRARGAKQLMLQNWVELLEQPLDKIRADLNVGEPPEYQHWFAGDRGIKDAA